MDKPTISGSRAQDSSKMMGVLLDALVAAGKVVDHTDEPSDDTGQTYAERCERWDEDVRDAAKDAVGAWKAFRDGGGAASFDQQMRLGFALDTLAAALEAEI